MKKITFTIIFTLIFCVTVFAQKSNLTCPTISVTGPSAVSQPDTEMDFTAEVSGIDTSKIGYKWMVSENRSFKGQGTNRILVDVKGLYDNAITATVEILNLPEGCPNIDSETGVVACMCKAILIDEFGKIPFDEQKNRFAEIKKELEKEPNLYSAVYIILYHPDKDNKNLDKRVERIKNYLIKENIISEDKLRIIFGGDEPEERTRIWLVPPGAEPPTP